MTAAYQARHIIPGDIIRHDHHDVTVTGTYTHPTTGHITLTLPAGHITRPGGALITVTTAAPRPGWTNTHEHR